MTVTQITRISASLIFLYHSLIILLFPLLVQLLNVSIESVTPENLNAVCTLLSQAYADTFETIQDIPSWVTIKLIYREPTWPEDESISVMIDKYNFYWNEETQKRELRELDTDAEAIREYILSEASWYEEKYIQAQ